MFKKVSEKFTGKDNDTVRKLLPLIRERISKLSELDVLIKDGEFEYYFNESSDYESEKLIWKKSDREKTIQHLEKVREIISENEEKNNPDEVKELLWNYAEEVGKGDVLWPTRYALSGRDKSPDPFTLISILGKEKTIQRIKNAINKLNEGK
jgi:glutamyl/glutaminyl-tRNA synthetase